jgi:hypothetical protein
MAFAAKSIVTQAPEEIAYHLRYNIGPHRPPVYAPSTARKSCPEIVVGSINSARIASREGSQLRNISTG